jgi:hypothetical protein
MSNTIQRCFIAILICLEFRKLVIQILGFNFMMRVKIIGKISHVDFFLLLVMVGIDGVLRKK